MNDDDKLRRIERGIQTLEAGLVNMEAMKDGAVKEHRRPFMVSLFRSWVVWFAIPFALLWGIFGLEPEAAMRTGAGLMACGWFGTAAMVFALRQSAEYVHSLQVKNVLDSLRADG